MDNHETTMHRKPVMKLFCNIFTEKKCEALIFICEKDVALSQNLVSGALK